MPSWKAGLIAVALVVAASLIGNAATMPAIPTWYAGLTKPSFNPPNWVFGPVWTALYASMAVAAWIVAERGLGGRQGAAPALLACAQQLALNAAWTPVFFGLRAPGWALGIVALLLVAVALTVLLFARVDRLAAALLLPYLAWTGYATALNAAIAL